MQWTRSISSPLSRLPLQLAVVLLLLFSANPLWADFKSAKGMFLRGAAVGDVETMLDALESLLPFDTKENAELLVSQGLIQEDILVHREVLKILAELKDAEARKVVADACADHKRWEVRASAAQVCSRYGEYAFAKLSEAGKDRQWQVRAQAYRALAGHRKRASIDFLIKRMKNEAPRVLWDLTWALEQLTGMSLGDQYTSWLAWWQPNSETFQVPTRKEAEEKLPEKAEKKDVGTAVREGLYGPIFSERVAFLFDVSGSMSVGVEEKGSRIQIAKDELVRVLQDQLSPSSYFNVITFSEDVKVYSKGLQKASKSKVRRAVKFVEALQAGGETNAFGALKMAFEDKNVDTIFLLSDGQPTVGEETIPAIIHQTVAGWNRSRKIVINCIGFFPGSAKNQDKKQAREFLKKLSLENDGVYLEIY
ncbi:MAG: VWA domain-containing protein [Planctomycetota bacterium]